MKSIFQYKGLIAQMPVQEQSFTTKRNTWEKKVEARVLDIIFKGNDSIKISREDIFLKCPIDQFI